MDLKEKAEGISDYDGGGGFNFPCLEQTDDLGRNRLSSRMLLKKCIFLPSGEIKKMHPFMARLSDAQRASSESQNDGRSLLRLLYYHTHTHKKKNVLLYTNDHL